jgi:Xaa-Pro aminopeptidase
MKRVLRAAALVLLPAAALAGELQDDLKARRARVMEAIGPESVLVHWSAPTRVFSRDVDYEYRQDSDMLYLTGIGQEGTTLVLMPGNKTKKSILFVSDADARREHWQGHLLTKQEAQDASGVDEVRLASGLDGFLSGLMNGLPPGERLTEYAGEYDVFFDALKAGQARLALVFGHRPGASEPLPQPFDFAERMRQRVPGLQIQDATPVVWGLRQVKTPYERGVLQRSAEVSADAHRAAMRAAKPGRYEYEVEAELEKVYLQGGAPSWGYPSIVGSGPNATILHYESSRRQMKAGELMLIDAAAFYEGMTVDITRAWPVSGKYSKEQAELWRLVLAAQEAGMKAAVAGNHTTDVEKAAEEVVKQGLLRLGLLSDAGPTSKQQRTWYTHGICHWIGLDVHDVGDYRRALEPGMSFVIEPGLYIREAALDGLEDTPENRAFKEKVRPVVQKYKDIGVRVEDSFLLTETGLVRLSARVPRTLEEIEAYLAGRE